MGKLVTCEIWSGRVCFVESDFEEDVVGGTVNVPVASAGAAVVGLRAVLDMHNFIPGDKIKEITILSDHTVTESALHGQPTLTYLQPIVDVLQSYKRDILEGHHADSGEGEGVAAANIKYPQVHEV